MDASPYFAPAYFAPAFFAPLAAASAVVPIAGSTYFAPTYFAPAFFAPGAASSGTTPSPVGSTYFAPTYFAPTFFAPGTSASAVASQYFAPSYFSPTFFGGATDPSSQPTSPVGTSPSPGSPADPLKPADPITPVDPPTTAPVAGQSLAYFAPSYFAPTFFPSLASSPVPVTTPVAQASAGRVQDGFRTMVGLLQGAGTFEDVIFGDPSRRGRAGAGQHPLAIVVPGGWEDADDYDPSSIVRRVSFAIRIVVRADDGAEPFDELHRLSSAVEALVNRADLGGQCLPALTRIRACRHDQAVRYPEQAVELEGDFSMLLDLEVLPSASA